jgi:esterase/lipase superfamily enzyme
MKTTWGIAVVAATMVLGAGYASATTVSSNVHALNVLSKQASPAQDVYWRRWHHRRHRHCWWRHGHRHCVWR